MEILQKTILSWGLSLADYKQMFELKEADLANKILDCCSGPGSFNSELSELNGHVISSDPLFALPMEELTQRINQVLDDKLGFLIANKENFEWGKDFSPQQMVAQRRTNLQRFLYDFPPGLQAGRYQLYGLPTLPFKEFQFDLALCSHYLFDESQAHAEEFITTSLMSLCRVAKEVRVFPLVNAAGEISSLVGPLMKTLSVQNYGLEIKAVTYKFEPKANAMLRVWSQTCEVKS